MSAWLCGLSYRRHQLFHGKIVRWPTYVLKDLANMRLVPLSDWLEHMYIHRRVSMSWRGPFYHWHFIKKLNFTCCRVSSWNISTRFIPFVGGGSTLIPRRSWHEHAWVLMKQLPKWYCRQGSWHKTCCVCYPQDDRSCCSFAFLYFKIQTSSFHKINVISVYLNDNASVEANLYEKKNRYFYIFLFSLIFWRKIVF